VLQVAKATRDKVKEERDPQDTYAARVAGAKAEVAEAKTDVAKAEYEAAKAKVDALHAKKFTAGAAWARENELVEAKTDKDRAYKAWEDAKTTHTLIMQTAAAAAAAARPAG